MKVFSRSVSNERNPNTTLHSWCAARNRELECLLVMCISLWELNAMKYSLSPSPSRRCARAHTQPWARFFFFLRWLLAASYRNIHFCPGLCSFLLISTFLEGKSEKSNRRRRTRFMRRALRRGERVRGRLFGGKGEKTVGSFTRIRESWA